MILRSTVASLTAGAALVAGALAFSSRPETRAMACPQPPGVASGSHSGRTAHSGRTTDSGHDVHLGHDAHRSHVEQRGHGHARPGGRDAGVTVGPTCNLVETAAPAGSTYVPDVRVASAAHRAKAERLLNGVNDFCRSSSAADVMSTWRPGLTDPTPTHFFNPDPPRGGLDPGDPKAALVYDGELDGVMFTGRPLPPLGSIPRPHTHDASERFEMLHVYCTSNLQEAFTPNRALGVNADTIRLRVGIRPALMKLDEGQLRALLAKVRSYAGDELAPVAPVENDEGAADPMLQAMRTEIRASLMLLTESQLRSARTSMRSG